MPIVGQPVLDYTDKDFESLRARLINIIRGAFPDWDDFEVANFGNVLLEAFAFTGDVLVNYQDNQARESRLSGANLRSNVLALAKMLGYEAATAAAATADVLFTLDQVPSNDVTFEAGTVVKTRDVTGAVEFQLLLDLTIPAGTNPPQAFGTVENSETILGETFQSNGLPNQEVKLSQTPYIDNTAAISTSAGAWTQVENFLSSTASDRHYVIIVDAQDRATVRFGNGVNGQIPSGQISSDYKIGGGTAGNVEQNNIVIIDGQFTDVLGTPVNVSVNNPDKASGGENRESVAQIKQNAPASVRVSDRIVSLEDYVIEAELVPGVARALMVTSDQLVGLPENRGRLYVVPVGGGTPSTALRDSVLTAVTITKPNTITFQVTVEAPVYETVDVGCTVFFTADADPTTVAAAIRTNLEAFFAISNADGTKNTQIDFGINYPTGRSATQESEIPFSDVYNVVRDTPGVRKIGDSDVDFLLNGASSDLVINPVGFPVLGTVTITDGDTGSLV